MRETSSLSYLFYLFAFWYSLSDKFISFVRHADIVFRLIFLYRLIDMFILFI